MNLCIVAGQIVRNATVKGNDRKVLRFTVETKASQPEGESRINNVPCVVFNPDPVLENTLTHQGEGQRVELQGRITSWDTEAPSRACAEVIVFNRSLALLTDQ